MGPYALSLIIVSLMDQPVQMVEVFTFSPKRSVQLSQTSVPRRYSLQNQQHFEELTIFPNFHWNNSTASNKAVEKK